MKSLFSALFLFCFFGGAALAAEEYTFDLSEIEKKPYRMGGYFEFRPVLFGLDQDAALYKLNLFNEKVGETITQYNERLWIDANIQKGIADFYLQLSADFQQSSVFDSTSKTECLPGLPFPQTVHNINNGHGQENVEVGQGLCMESGGLCGQAERPRRPGTRP